MNFRSMRSAGTGGLSYAPHDVERDVGNQVEEKDADLEDRHAGVVKHVELLD